MQDNETGNGKEKSEMNEKKELRYSVEINGESYFTRHGAARELEVSPMTIDRWAMRRMLQYFKHPKLGKLYSPESIASFVERQTVRAKR